MDKHRASAPGDARARIMVDLDDEIVEVVPARKPVCVRVCGDLDRLIIMTICRILAPAVRRSDALKRQRGNRTRMLVGAPPQSLQPELTARRTGVALALVGFDSAPSQRHR